MFLWLSQFPANTIKLQLMPFALHALIAMIYRIIVTNIYRIIIIGISHQPDISQARQFNVVFVA